MYLIPIRPINGSMQTSHATNHYHVSSNVMNKEHVNIQQLIVRSITNVPSSALLSSHVDTLTFILHETNPISIYLSVDLVPYIVLHIQYIQWTIITTCLLFVILKGNVVG